MLVLLSFFFLLPLIARGSKALFFFDRQIQGFIAQGWWFFHNVCPNQPMLYDGVALYVLHQGPFACYGVKATDGYGYRFLL
jgi:hypothetical protein